MVACGVKALFTLGNFSCNLTGVLHCAICQQPATDEDRGDNNKDPDWLIEQSIERQVAGRVSHCAAAIESC